MVERTVADRPLAERDYAYREYVERPAAVRRISWGAIFAGTVIAMVVQVLLGMLGVGIGATTIDPATQGSPSGQAFSMGAAVWWVVSSLVAVFLGAMVAGRLAGMPRRQDGALHGLVTWGFSTLVLFWLLTTTVSGLVGGAMSIVGQSIQTGAIVGAASSGQQASQTGQGGGQITEAIRQQANELIARITGRSDISAEDAAAAAQALASSGGDEAAAARTLAERTGMSEEQARQAIAEWKQRGQQAAGQASETARQGAERTAEVVAKASIWSFVAFVLGAIAAALGGAAGAPRDLTVAGIERR
jgi:hypothetical protein